MLEAIIISANIISIFSVIILAFFIFEKPKKYNYKFYPKVSIIIAAKNEEKRIAKCISKILTQNYPKSKMEIIIASDSTDRTNEIVKGFGEKVILFNRKNGKGKWNDLNYSVARSKNDIIVLVDADIEASKNWLKNLVGPFVDEKISLVAGSTSVENPKSNWISSAQALFYSLGNDVTKSLFNHNIIYLASGQNMAFRKSLWKKIKFRKSITEDTDFSVRAQSLGATGKHVHDALVYTRVPTRISDFHNRYVRWFSIPALNLRIFCFGLLFFFGYLNPGTLLSLIYLLLQPFNQFIFLTLIIQCFLIVCVYFYYLKIKKRNFGIFSGLYLLFLSFIQFFLFFEARIRRITGKQISWKRYD